MYMIYFLVGQWEEVEESGSLLLSFIHAYKKEGHSRPGTPGLPGMLN